MRNYQVIGLIGTTIGILLMLGLLTTFGFLGGLSDRVLQDEDNQVFLAGVFLALVAYIAALTIIFVAAAKHSKAVGILLILIGLLTIVMTNGWGIIPFALLLPAGIVALVYKGPKKNGRVRRAIIEEDIEEGDGDEGGGEEVIEKRVTRDNGITYYRDPEF